MQKKENFDFKHKKPNEIKTIKHDTEEIQIVTKEVKHPQNSIIKPKAEPRNKRVQLLLTESNHLKIKEYAINNGTSVNDVINQIIENM